MPLPFDHDSGQSHDDGSCDDCGIYAELIENPYPTGGDYLCTECMEARKEAAEAIYGKDE